MPYETLSPVNCQVTRERGGSEGKRGDSAGRETKMNRSRTTKMPLVTCCVSHADPDVVARVIVCAYIRACSNYSN